MKIMDKLKPSAISCNLMGASRKEVMEELSVLLAMNCGKKPDDIMDALWERETASNTALNGGLGVPHAAIKGLTEFYVGFGISKKGVNCKSADGNPTHFFFVFLAPAGDMSNRMDLLAKVSRLFSEKTVKNELLKADTAQEVLAIIGREELGL
ncbi:MAG: PTS sugar transporter subunit IIA [Deltaproteobacteria bacterium]|nr:PTS sugar transporter subunit IIA [Deltaproteobacteria bacterium]